MSSQTDNAVRSLGRLRHFVLHYSLIVLRAVLNIFLVYLLTTKWHIATYGFPLLAEGVVQIFLSEVNFFKQNQRYKRATQALEGVQLLEEGKHDKKLQCVASVVGYREEPDLYRHCLESYRNDYDGCVKALCMGIDGDQIDDMAMVDVARDVFGKSLNVIELSESLASLAASLSVSSPSSGLVEPLSEKHSFEQDRNAGTLDVLIHRASDILDANGLLYTDDDYGPVPICITQPHHSKKEIMFTTFIFSLAIARANDIHFVWSSDSDSWVYPGTLETALKSILLDDKIGGTATRFSIHNRDESALAYLVAATYEADFALQIGLLSSFDTTDCQPGPCALFRVSALEPVVLDWFNQSILGFRPLVNDDRHLTTRLLLANHSVTSNPTITTATDTPVTISRYCVQQIRWARAAFVEGTCYPRMFLLHSPILCLSTYRRFYIPLLNIYIVTRYLLTSDGTAFSSLADIAARLALCALYSSHRLGAGLPSVPVHAASQLLFQIPQSAFQVWAFATMFENQWGTTMRSAAERARGKTGAWLVRQAGPLGVVGVWLCMVAAALGKCLAAKMEVSGAWQGEVGVAAAGVTGCLFGAAVWRDG